MNKLPSEIKKVLDTVEAEGFEEEPILMMRAVRLAAELDFDFPKSLHQAIVKQAHLLDQVDVSAIRGEFEKIITAKHAGKGLRILASAELMPIVVGEAAMKMTSRQVELFHGLAEGIDNTKKDLVRSLGLFYRCFEKNGRAAMERLQYDQETYQHLSDALTQFESVFFLADKMEFKQYVAAVGLERYEYMHNLAKAQHLVYGKHDFKVENRDHIMKEIKENDEPIFLEDLAISGEDIIEAGIADGQKVGVLLQQLLDMAHRFPERNTKADLLVYAEQFNKSKLRASFRKMKWIK